MTLSLQQWHSRFQKQALWTQPLRRHLYKLVNLDQIKRVIEIGCGSGAVLGELPQYTDAAIFGLDIDINYLIMAMRSPQCDKLIQADAFHLPLPSSSFDMSFCHYLLLWVNNPHQVLQEMVRITCPGGYVCVLAEPDYSGRIDFPDRLSNLGQYQTKALRSQGANPEIGRQLRSLLTHVGLIDVVSGVLGGQWALPFNYADWESEWEVLEADLAEIPDSNITKEQKAQDQSAWTAGERILYVPTFYAWGKAPG